MKNLFIRYQWAITAAAAAGLLTYVLTRKSVQTFLTKTVSNMYNEEKIISLHPAARDKARQFINAAEAAGINLTITSGYRSIAKQNELYAQGRTAPGSIVTNAKGGQSYHNFGLAIDVIEIRDGKALWKESEGANWNRIAAIGKAAGFAWGGDFKNLVDKPHFQLNTGLTLAQLQTLYATGKTKNGYVVLA